MVKPASFIRFTVDKRFFHPLLVGDIQKRKSTVDIRFYENTGVFDGVVHVTLCRKVDHAANIIFVKKIFYQFTITDVSLDKFVTIV